MQEHVTLLQSEEPTPGGAGVSSGLPPDLLEQVRGRVRLLAMLLMAGFAFDPAVYVLTWTASRLTGTPIPPEILADVPFFLADALVAIASAAVWWLARRDWISPSRLLTVGLVYQVVICLEIGITMPWQFYLSEGNIPQTAGELSRRLADVEGAERWSTATARVWWDTHLPVGAGSPA
jgi:hypothetical protein